jgi:hypothetical protein
MSSQLFVQAQPFTLSGAGASIGDATITLTSFTDIDGNLLTMADIGTLGFSTIEPGNGTQEEAITFTGVTQNGNGTATLTGVKSQMFKSPYTQVAGLLKSHAGGTYLILTNSAGFYNQLASLVDAETISGLWTFTTLPQSAVMPLDALDMATKAYVDNRHGYWEAPVATAAALPAGVNTGEVRVVLDTMLVYIWNGAAWQSFTAAAVVTNVTYYLGSEAVGGDHRTFLAGTTWSTYKSLHLFRNGMLMAYGATADYLTTNPQTAIFNFDVLDTDIITLLLIQ